MEIDKAKIQNLVYKLSKATIENEIEWKIEEHPNVKLSFEGELIGKVYRTKYREKYFRIYGYTYEAYNPDFDKLYKTSRESLELVDIAGVSLWEFPYYNSISDLYETIKYKIAGVDDLLEGLLDDD